MRIFILVTVILLVGAQYFVSPALASPTSDATNEGKEFFLHANLKEAIARFTEAIELNPKDPTIYNWRGLSYLGQGNHESSKLGNRGTAYLTMFQAAANDFSKEIQLEPKNAAAYSNRGQCYDYLNQFDKAIADYNKAIEIDPGNSGAYQGRARIYRKQKQYGQALSDCDKALALVTGTKSLHDVQAANLHIDRGAIHEDQGKFQEAIDDYNKSIAIAMANEQMSVLLPSFYANRAEAFFKKKQYQKAIDDCEKAVSFAPTPCPASAVITFGHSCSALGEDQKALDNYTQGIKSFSDFAQAYFERAKVYRKLGKYSLADKDLQTSKQLGYSEPK